MRLISKSNNWILIDYKNEPYSYGDSCKTICCRGDITGTSPGGCYDTKLTDFFNAQTRSAHILNGPSIDGNLPAFSWSQFENIVHQGMPEIFNFSFILTQPSF